MTINYIIAVSTGNADEHQSYRPVGASYKTAERAFDTTVSRYSSQNGGPFTVQMVKVDSDAKSVKIVKEDVVGV